MQHEFKKERRLSQSPGCNVQTDAVKTSQCELLASDKLSIKDSFIKRLKKCVLIFKNVFETCGAGNRRNCSRQLVNGASPQNRLLSLPLVIIQ